MNNKTVAVGLGGLALGILIGWSVTADRLEAKMRRNQLLLGEMLARKEAEIHDLQEKLLHPVPWTSPTDQDVQEAALATEQIISDEDREAGISIRNQITAIDPLEGVEFDSIVDRSGVAPDPVNDDFTPEEEAEIAEAVNDHRRNIQSVIAKYASDPDEIDSFTDLVRRDAAHANETPPFHISVGQFASDPDEGDDYEKITLEWYSRNRILLDDDQEVIPDVNSHVGYNNLNRFGEESGDPDVVFVRNRRLETDFEIVLHADEDPPLHVQYQLTKEEYNTYVAAGNLPKQKKFREEDSD